MGRVSSLVGVVSEWAWPVGRARGSGGSSRGARGGRVPGKERRTPGRGAPSGTRAGSWVPAEPLGLGGGVGGPTRNIPQPCGQCWKGLEWRDYIDGHVLLGGP